MEMNELNQLSYKVRAAIFSVFKEPGPGLLESVYETALAQELSFANLNVCTQVPIPVYYKGIKQDLGFRLDILVNNEIIIEVKSIDILLDVHKKQLLTYLKLANKRLGFLVNFNVAFLVDKESLIRIIN